MKAGRLARSTTIVQCHVFCVISLLVEASSGGELGWGAKSDVFVG